jgi:hypothetical protein
MSRDLASSLRQDRKDKQRAAAADGNPTDESAPALLIGSPSRRQTSAGQPEKTREQLDSANESLALIGHDASSLEQERRAEEGEAISVDESCSRVMEQQQQQAVQDQVRQQQAVQDQVQQLQAVQDQVQQQQLVEPDWESRRQEKS